jgi:hypothetical protein
MKELTQLMLHELLDYDSLTGIFKWKSKRKGININKILGSSNGFGYLRITVCGKSYYSHRLAWFYIHGNFPKYEIDHINGNQSDNRISNLREATGSENTQNKFKPQKNNKSGELGVSWSKSMNKWQSHISVNKQRKYLGCFNTIGDAKNAYLIAKKELHPFANVERKF